MPTDLSQVPTKTGSFTYQVRLTVVVPKAAILGGPELHLQSGSTVALQCVIDGVSMQTFCEFVDILFTKLTHIYRKLLGI